LLTSLEYLSLVLFCYVSLKGLAWELAVLGVPVDSSLKKIVGKTRGVTEMYLLEISGAPHLAISAILV